MAIIENQKDKKSMELEPKIINLGNRLDSLSKIYITWESDNDDTQLSIIQLLPTSSPVRIDVKIRCYGIGR